MSHEKAFAKLDAEYAAKMPQTTSAPSGFWHRQWHEAWKTVRKAPTPFITCTVIASGILCIGCYWFVDHLYAATLQTVKEERDRTNRENDKLAKQVEGLRIYRSNDQIPLKKKALILAEQIRDFTKNWKNTDPPEVQNQNVGKYLNRFGLRAQIMRDDLDQNGQTSERFDKVMFEFSGSYSDVRTIASEIERLAEKLPD